MGYFCRITGNINCSFRSPFCLLIILFFSSSSLLLLLLLLLFFFFFFFIFRWTRINRVQRLKRDGETYILPTKFPLYRAFGEQAFNRWFKNDRLPGAGELSVVVTFHIFPVRWNRPSAVQLTPACAFRFKTVVLLTIDARGDRWVKLQRLTAAVKSLACLLYQRVNIFTIC